MVDLDNFDLAKLLDGTVVYSKEDKALVRAIGYMLQYVYQKTTLIDPESDPPEWVLDHIAIAEKVDLYSANLTYQQKKALIENSDFLKRKKGTVPAIEVALSSIFDSARVYEWFEYGGEPSHFYVDIVFNTSITENERNLALKVIKTYKRASSILDNINFYLKNDPAILYTGATMLSGEIITVYPKEV